MPYGIAIPPIFGLGNGCLLNSYRTVIKLIPKRQTSEVEWYSLSNNSELLAHVYRLPSHQLYYHLNSGWHQEVVGHNNRRTILLYLFKSIILVSIILKRANIHARIKNAEQK